MGRPRSCNCGECAKCKRADEARARYQEMTLEERRAWIARRDPERVRAADRARGFRGNGTPDPFKKKARTAVSNAVRDGRLRKPKTCPACGCGHRRIEAHHTDYSKPLDVTWLCSVCHGAEHKQGAA